jgi:acetoin utilization protein AcuB
MENDTLKIADFMTEQPQTIHANAPLEHAKLIMREHGIRHLPVVSDWTVVGIVSERDLDQALGFEGLNPCRFVVMDICHGHPYVVHPDAPLTDVVAEMARRHIGSAIVMDGRRPVGIFTTVDACRALAAIARYLRPCWVDEGE